MSDLYYTKKVNCLYCKKEFNTYRVRVNRAKFIKRDPDHCPYYEEENPLLYEVNVCPRCGLSFTDSFSEIKASKLKILKENYIAKIQGVPKLNEQRNIQDALTAYKFALYAATILEENDLIIANLGLRIAWLYRYLKDEQEEKRFLKNVLDLYIEIYETQNLDRLSMDKYMLIYLIGELYGRLGEYEKTVRWFSFIIEDKKATPRILKLTKDRWYDFKEKLDEKRKTTVK